MQKIYIVKDGSIGKSLTTAMCMGTNDKSKYPVDCNGKPVEMSAHFNQSYKGKQAYITENPIEIELFTRYLINTQNPYFYDLDNPTNSQAFYRNMSE
jgi:hypothetical protein